MSDACDRTRVVNTVLIVDDDATFVKALTRSFAREGRRVLPTTDGNEAIRIAHTERVDLAVIDLAMPPPNGIEVVRQLSAIEPPPYLIVLSGYLGTAQTVAAMKAGADDCLDKDSLPQQPARFILARAEHDRGMDPGSPDEPTLEQAIKNRVARALVDSHDNKTEAAERLDVSRPGLQKMLKKWRGEIRPQRQRDQDEHDQDD